MAAALKMFLFFAVLSVSNTAFSQKTVETHYINADGDTVKTKTEARYYYVVQTNGKSRISFKYDTSDLMLSETYYRKDKVSTTTRDSGWWTFGICREWYPSGQLKFDGKYVFGQLHDTLTTFYPSGALRRKDVYFKDSLLLGQCYAQDSSKIAYFPYQEQPEFKGGQRKMFEFLANSVKYPKKSREDGVEGTIYVGFVVNKTGEIVDIKIRRGVSPELNAEAVRVVKLMPKWKAGKQDGELVRVAYTLPIKFQLN